MSSRFEQTSAETIHEGPMFAVKHGAFRHEDGEEVERDYVVHPGAVAIVAHDDEQLWLVRQPREATGEPDLLELPAGKLDQEGESTLEAAKRELGEEIGKAAERWERLKTFYTSPGFTNEQCHVFLATGLSDAGEAEADQSERIDIVKHPLERLDELIAEAQDSKTLIGLYELRLRRA